VNVAVFVGVAVKVAVLVGVGVNVAVFVGVAVNVAVFVGVGVNVAVFVGVAVNVAVLVGVGVKVAVFVGVGVNVAVFVGVAVNVAVLVGVGVNVTVAVFVAVGVLVGRQLPGFVTVPVSRRPTVCSGREVSSITVASILISVPAGADFQALVVMILTVMLFDDFGPIVPKSRVVGTPLATYWPPETASTFTLTPVASERSPVLLTVMVNSTS
jgi:hypothetical protein